MNLKQLRDWEETLLNNIEQAYEEYGKKFVGRFYIKRVRKGIRGTTFRYLTAMKDTTKGVVDEPQFRGNYIYIYGVDGQRLLCINFECGGIHSWWLMAEQLKESWVQITKEEGIQKLKELLAYLKIEDVLKVV